MRKLQAKCEIKIKPVFGLLVGETKDAIIIEPKALKNVLRILLFMYISHFPKTLDLELLQFA